MPNRRRRMRERQVEALARANALRASFDGRPLLLTRSGSVNWITGGLSDPLDLTTASDPVWVLLSDECQALVTTEIEAPRLELDFDVASEGWTVVAVPWYDSSGLVDAVADLVGRGVTVLSDRGDLGVDVTSDLVATRLVLTGPERDDLRELGADVSVALDRAIDSWRPGVSTDFDVASVLAGELEACGARAVCLIVGGDDRVRQLRHPLAVGEVMNEAAMAVVVARRSGLHVAATRLAVRHAEDPIVALVDELRYVDEAVRDATRPGCTWGDAVTALGEAYRNGGYDGAWREHYQGGPIGFEQREFELAPGQTTSPYWHLPCATGSAVAWNPSLRGGAKIEATYVVTEGGLESVTASHGGDNQLVKVVR